jgi:nickel-dependent lactate racemase
MGLEGKRTVKRYLNYEGGRINFSLPETWNVICDQDQRPVPVVDDVGAEIMRALDSPIGAPRIEELAKPGMTVALLFDDGQRPTPSDVALPEIMNRLNRAGVPDESISAVCAMGTHPIPNDEQLRIKVGEEVMSRLNGRVLTHDAKSAENIVVGKTASGSVVEINRTAASADLIIGVGQCMPHPGAGYSGGYKIVLPGISSYRAVADHHFSLVGRNQVGGNRLDGNLFWEKIVEAGRLTKLAFKLDFVINEKKEVIRAFGGNPEAEQREASRFAESLYVAHMTHQPDITITSAAPLEIGVQATKALAMATGCTRPGGTIIWVASQKQAGPILPLIKEMGSPQSAAEVRRRFSEGDIPEHLKDFGISYIMQIVDFKEVVRRFKIVHVTEGLSPELVGMMGMTYASDIQTAIDRVSLDTPKADVAIFPSGGNVIPIVQ